MACPQGIDPLYERRNSYDFYRGLGIRLGQEKHWPWETVEQVYDHCLAPIGITFKEFCDQYGIFGDREFRRYEKYGFGTPSGKVELKSSIFEDLNLSPVPVYHEPLLSPVGSPNLAEKYPDPLVTIHPSTASALGLAEGDWAVISSPMGKIRQRVHISDAIREDMADVEHGWWFPETEEKLPTLFKVFESSANVLCRIEKEV